MVGWLEEEAAPMGFVRFEVEFEVEFEGTVAGHSARPSFEPAKPPMRVCTSHIPEGGLVSSVARFHSIRMAPAWEPWVETMVSAHSTQPD